MSKSTVKMEIFIYEYGETSSVSGNIAKRTVTY